MMQIFSYIGIAITLLAVGGVGTVLIGALNLRGMSAEEMDNYDCQCEGGK